ncbi:hypothetical protein DOTSEDRAFT_84385 [Lecanosticta acicola]|uniref:Zn(2)-C6 fungal-type domain-containing protein n=1 Tax=Lecanosticta acicola TaxID=111012 RepID=A0AAI8YXN3_9PEZI|nr:hypothetical protein DOTSEDRAFT_84385 [Lecanosticta acicola]
MANTSNAAATAITSAPRKAQSAGQDAPRKRRRKTSSGAQDDCFACRRQARSCDRKRPYCTQCLESGRECSGYKTTLTWNVGVASRGKLRGLSCPVTAKTPGGDDNVSNEHSRQQKSTTNKVKEENKSVSTTTSPGRPSHQPRRSSPTSAPSYRPSLPTIPSAHDGWQGADFQPHYQPHTPAPVPLHLSLQHIRTAFGPQYDGPHSGSSVASHTDTDFHSPFEYPQTPGSVTHHDPLTAPPSYTSAPFHGAAEQFPDPLSSSVDSIQTAASYGANAGFDMMRNDLTPFQPASMGQDDMMFPPAFDLSARYNSFDRLEDPQQDDGADFEEESLALLDPRFSSPFFHAPPRTQTLMEYYDRHICPFLVAFDGPDNPYRMYILQLATQNEGLQNAVAALALNNFRMRRKQPQRQIGFVEEITDAFDGIPRHPDSNEPTPEETCYKQMSIDQLNMQLTEPRAAHDDSVVATLLILCLFHVCDSGFSKFKTQLAGVQKLLSLRSRHGQSDFTRWVEMFFIWFDVVTSAVNDREMQIQSESLDMLDYSANLGALEQFSGCDGRLFKLIARLGRLNLLAQGRPVKRQDGEMNQMPRPPSKRTSTQQSGRKRKMQHGSPSALDYDNVDGNGWGTPIISSDEEADFSPDETCNYPSVPDDRLEFWSEWNDVRSRLQAWQMDSSAFHNSPPPSSTSGPVFEMGQRDLLHINESFRNSALLYTERLGHPVLPSSHPNFQSYVSKALYHITSLEITSCVNKFLLWPLFIVGTECVDEGSRNVIRTRCHEIQKESGFYNNLSGLEVLERVWREVGSNVPGSEAAEVRARRRDSEGGKTGKYRQAFRWRKAMDRVDGEYLLM